LPAKEWLNYVLAGQLSIGSNNQLLLYSAIDQRLFELLEINWTEQRLCLEKKQKNKIIIVSFLTS
jgi:hypothetical protein